MSPFRLIKGGYLSVSIVYFSSRMEDWFPSASREVLMVMNSVLTCPSDSDYCQEPIICPSRLLSSLFLGPQFQLFYSAPPPQRTPHLSTSNMTIDWSGRQLNLFTLWREQCQNTITLELLRFLNIYLSCGFHAKVMGCPVRRTNARREGRHCSTEAGVEDLCFISLFCVSQRNGKWHDAATW